MKGDPSRCPNGTYPELPSYAWRPAVSITVYALILIFAGVFSVAMIVRRAHNPVKARSVPLVLFAAVGTLIAGLIRGLEETTTPVLYSCDLAFASSMVFPMFIGPPLCMRLLRLAQLYRLSRKKASIALKQSSISQEWQDELNQLKRWTKDTPLMGVVVVAAIPYVVASIIIYYKQDSLGNNCVNCKAILDVIIACSILSVIWGTLTVATTWYTRNIVDSLHLRREILHCMVMWIVIILTIGVFTSVPPLKKLQDGGIVLPSVWYVIAGVAQFVVMIVLPTLGTWNIGPYKSFAKRRGFLPMPLRRRDSNLARQEVAALHGTASVDSAQSNPPLIGGPEIADMEHWELVDFLTDREGLAAFTRHLATEFSIENIKFWLHAGQFKQAALAFRDQHHSDTTIRDQRAELLAVRARWVYNTYVSNIAPLMVNISDSLATKCANELQSNPSNPQLFEGARREIYLLMERDVFPRFLRGREFKNLQHSRSATETPQRGRCCCGRSRHSSGDDDPVRSTELTSI